MIWLLPMPIVIFFIFKNLWFDDDPGEFLDWFITGLFGCVFSGLAFGLLCGGAILTGLAFSTHPEETSHSTLEAIRDKDGITGTFFLGSGVIKGDQYYFYYERMQDGGFRPGKVYAGSGVRVYEEDRTDAELVTFKWELNASWAWLVAFPVNTGGYSYDFHVPKGTIRTGYTM
jgi:hypothetical protein